MSEVMIRIETANDIDAIREINIEAFRSHPFSQQTEHLIVDALRAADALYVSLVAITQGRVIGHIAFSEARLDDSATGWFLLGPVAVLPAFQGQGTGSALVESGLERLREGGARGCVLVGDAAFYGRFGFGTFPGLEYDGVPHEHVLALPLENVVPCGLIRAHEAFEIEPG
ncbi:MAG: GNAT family N-acetyltransferase [Actinobacteria bacterium HGW-Actinobacteria-6]|nr:MAG: GNAT family N-acetyltransferase [Actinobacteria bacterium HGW-Actinobacteria-6]